MKTLDSIIEKQIRARIDENELCRDLVLSASSDPQGYDQVISEAVDIVEQLIKNNFDFIIELASDIEYEPEEDEEGEEREMTFAAENIAEEDQDMLRYIAE